MKKLYQSLLVLSVALLLVFGVVACSAKTGTNDSTSGTDSNSEMTTPEISGSSPQTTDDNRPSTPDTGSSETTNDPVTPDKPEDLGRLLVEDEAAIDKGLLIDVGAWFSS